MGRLTIKQAARGMRLTNRRTRESGTVTSVGEDRLRVRLDSGRRLDVVDDGSGQVRWGPKRRSAP